MIQYVAAKLNSQESGSGVHMCSVQTMINDSYAFNFE